MELSERVKLLKEKYDAPVAVTNATQLGRMIAAANAAQIGRLIDSAAAWQLERLCDAAGIPR